MATEPTAAAPSHTHTLYTTPPLDPAIEKKLTAIVEPLKDEKLKEAVLIIAKAAPDHAEDILKKAEKFKTALINAKMKKTFGFEGVSGTNDPSRETELSIAQAALIKAFKEAAADYSQRSGGKDEQVVDALTTLSGKITPAEKAESAKHVRAVISPPKIEDPAEEGISEEEKAKRKAAKDAQGKSEGIFSGDLGTMLMKMFVAVIGSLLGIDTSKMFGGGDERREEAAAPKPADMTGFKKPELTGAEKFAQIMKAHDEKAPATARDGDVPGDHLVRPAPTPAVTPKEQVVAQK